MKEQPTRTVKYGRPCLDYKTRTVPDDEYNGLNIGKGWRKHWTVLCPECNLPSPYVVDLNDGKELYPDKYSDRDEPHNLVVDLWTLKCPRCSHRWIWESEYYEDD